MLVKDLKKILKDIDNSIEVKFQDYAGNSQFEILKEMLVINENSKEILYLIGDEE